jgi:TolB-like protein
MKTREKSFVLGLLMTISILGFAQETPQTAVSIDKAITDSMDYLVGRLAPGSTVVVLNFTAPTQAVSDYVIEELTTYLVNDGNLTIVDRRNLELLDQEVDYQLTGEVSDATAVEFGHKLGAQTIISGSLRVMGDEYRLRIQALSVETAQIQGAQNRDVVLDRRFATLLGVEIQEIQVEKELPSWSNKWLYFGTRGGASLRFYTLSGDIKGDVEPNSITYEAGVHLGLQITRFLAVQVEALYTADKVSYSGEGYEASFESQSLVFPALVKLTFRPGNFLFAVFGGGYYSLPLDKLKASSDVDEAASFDMSIPIGVVGGLNLGLKMGPGALFLDARYGMELGNTSIKDDKGNLAIYSRTMASVTLGYEIGIITRK